MPKPTYSVNGETFTLKPTTVKNRQLVEEFGQKLTEFTDEELENRDEYTTYFELFKLITEGPHDKIVFEEFDVKVGEEAYDDFLPKARRTALALTGF
jgi:hypothetical protein